MKKSTAILTLALMGSAGILTGCGEDIPASTFSSVAQCAASGQYTMQECQKGFEDARIDNKKNAPVFMSEDECEEIFGDDACERGNEGGSSVFMPMMMGYMMGSHSSHKSHSKVYPQAIYKDRSGTYVNSGGSYFGSKFGSVKVNSSNSSALGKPSTATSTRSVSVTRGVFGARGGASVTS